MSLSPGTRVGLYEVAALLGAGGMGEVYRARDPRLGRDVALNVLPAALRDDPDRLARFEREARALASLNHPNIAIVHGVEDVSGRPAIVMELVEGETLAERVTAGRYVASTTSLIRPPRRSCGTGRTKLQSNVNWKRGSGLDAGAPWTLVGGAGRRSVESLAAMRHVTETDPVTLDELRRMLGTRFHDVVKGVVDLRRGVMLLDADMHADQEAALLAEGSSQVDLWGINLYPELLEAEWLEFDSMINLRPSFGNRSRGIDDAATRAAVGELVGRLVRR